MGRRRPLLKDLFLWAGALFRRAFGLRVVFSMGRGRRGQSVWLQALAAVSPQAYSRGLRLLLENLSPQQRKQYERAGYFEVFGGHTGNRYRIRQGAQTNIELLDKKGTPIGELCFMPEGELPVGDVMLAQKIALELFEQDALKVANLFFTDHSVWSRDASSLGLLA